MKRFSIILAALLVFPINAASGVFGGTSAVGDPRVVGILFGQSLTRSWCTGSLISPQVVVTAAHCLGTGDSPWPAQTFIPANMWVSSPGVDLNSDDKNKRVQVARAILTKDYDSTFNTTTRNYIGQKDDIAFLILIKPLVNYYTIEIATLEEVQQLKEARGEITHIGYGLQDVNTSSGQPFLTKLKLYSQGSSKFQSHPALEQNTMSTEESFSSALCPGDSGGPWYATINGVEKLVAVQGAGGGCINFTTFAGSLGTVIAPYISLLKSDFNDTSNQNYANKILKDRADLRRNLEKRVEHLMKIRPSYRKNIQTIKMNLAQVKPLDPEVVFQATSRLVETAVLALEKLPLACVKGPIIKKVYGPYQKCPSGFRAK